MEYHVYWPGNNDPFWQNNQPENQGRLDYYNVSGVPDLRVDGRYPANPGTLPTVFNNRSGVATHCTIGIVGNYVSATREGSVTITVTPDGAMPADTWMLRVALTGSNFYYNTSYNDYHYNVMLDMLPGYQGTTIDMVGTDPVQVSLDFVLQASVPSNQGALPVDDQLAKVVAWVQPFGEGAPAYREVYQAAMAYLRDLDPTGVGAAPAVFAMGASYPNPFNPKTTIPVSVREAGSAVLEILTADGRLVRVLHEGAIGAGSHEFAWDGTDGAGQKMASGVYLARLTSATENYSQRMVLLK